jgi:hypothetical protein
MSNLTQPQVRVNPGKPRKPHVATRPATGTWRCAVQPVIGWLAHPGVLVITSEDSRSHKLVSTAYEVDENRDGTSLVGYTLTKHDGTVYDLPADLSMCDCPDREFHPKRPGGCRHMRALAPALKPLAL